MNDPDVHLFQELIAGDDIRPSHVFAPKPDKEDAAAPDLSVHLTNWKSAEDHPEVTQQLVEEEISKGWLICFDGSVEDTKQRWPHGVAIGKLGVAISDSRPPRLVVDYTVCGTNPNCNIQEHQHLPSAKEVQRCYPLREHSEERGALGLDAKISTQTLRHQGRTSWTGGIQFKQQTVFLSSLSIRSKIFSILVGTFGSFLDEAPSPCDLCGSLFISVCG